MRLWTPDDDAVLLELWGTDTARHVAARIGRTLAAARRRRKVLLRPKARGRGRSSRRWTDDETAIVAFFWGEERRETTAHRVGRSVGAVEKHLSRHGITGGARRGRISVAEFARRARRTRAVVAEAIKASGLRPVVICEYRVAGVTYRHRFLTDEQVASLAGFMGVRLKNA